MTAKAILNIGYLILWIGALITAILSDPSFAYEKYSEMGMFAVSLTLFFLFFLLWPYLVMGRILKKYSWWSPQKLVLECILIFFVSGVGIYLMTYLMYFTQDAQAGIGLLFIPIIQIAVYGVLISFFFVTFKKGPNCLF